MTADFFLLGILVCLSAFFSAVETAFVSLSEIRVQHLVETGRKDMDPVKALKENSHRLIITILIGNNLVNIAASAVATEAALDFFGSEGTGLAVGLAVGIMTFIILVFGEITPKTLAMVHNEKITMLTAPAIRSLQFVFLPLIVFLEWIAKAITRPVATEKETPIITEDEIKSVVNMGEEAGEVEEDERIMIHNIFRFSDMEASEIMTDRTRIFALSAERTASNVAPEVVKRGYSRIPVYLGSLDNVVGILYAKEVLHALITGRGHATAKELARPPIFVPETAPLDDLLRQFQSRKVHIALVVDEHGGVSGLVTIEDLLEEIVGDIMDETDHEPVLIQKIGKNKALVKGETEVEEVNRVLHLGLDEQEDYETISGFILSKLRHIPQVGEEIQAGNAVIRVTRADMQRIIEVEIESL